MKIVLLTKTDSRGDRAEAAMRAVFDAEQHTIETLRIECNNKNVHMKHDFQCDWLISYLCPWILPKEILDQARHNCNFHPAPPEYPGTGCYNFALYDGAKEYGVTCHRMEPMVDSGEIYKVRRFPVFSHDSVDTLQDRTDDIMFELYQQILGQLAGGEESEVLKTCGEHWAPGKTPTSSRDLDRLRVVPFDASAGELARRARAMAHRRYHSGGACIELHGSRFYIPFEEAMRLEPPRPDHRTARPLPAFLGRSFLGHSLSGHSFRDGIAALVCIFTTTILVAFAIAITD
jgi:methionyl-tRNA formyltransferase